MAAMIVYGLATCDTCRKALRALPQARLVDVRAQGVPDAVLRAALGQFGRALLNTRSATWRGLPEPAREGHPLALLAAHPALMRRPLIARDGRLWLGWGPDVQADLAAS